MAARSAASGVLALSGLSILALLIRSEAAGPAVPGEPATLRPPGALAEAGFLAACIRCERCRDACEAGCIRIARPPDGAGRGTPFIVARERGCTLCLECTRVCPTGALRRLEEVEDVAMGVAVIDERTCVAINRTGVCGACHTVCPLRNRAITLGLHNAPAIHDDKCVGCGLCEEACILDGTKAIRVFPRRKGAA